MGKRVFGFRCKPRSTSIIITMKREPNIRASLSYRTTTISFARMEKPGSSGMDPLIPVETRTPKLSTITDSSVEARYSHVSRNFAQDFPLRVRIQSITIKKGETKVITVIGKIIAIATNCTKSECSFRKSKTDHSPRLLPEAPNHGRALPPPSSGMHAYITINTIVSRLSIY